MKILMSIVSALILSPYAYGAESNANQSCTQEAAFGIKFGSDVHDYKPSTARRARGLDRFAAYDVKDPSKNSKFFRISVEADRITGEIYSVTAYTPQFDSPPESEYDSAVVPEIREIANQFAMENHVVIPTEGRPPYSAVSDGIDYSVWHDYSNGKLSYTFTCVNQQYETLVIRRGMEDFKKSTK